MSEHDITTAGDATPLGTTEASTLERLESTIKDGLATFIAVGTALTAIREGRLYRSTHPTFEAYCQDRWQMSRQRAHQLIDGSQVAETVNPGLTEDTPPITNEKQARAMSKAPQEKRPEVWREATKASRGKAPTAKQVKAAVETVAPQPKSTAPPDNGPPTPPPPQTTASTDATAPNGYNVPLRPENQARFEAKCKGLGISPIAQIQGFILDFIRDSVPAKPNGQPNPAEARNKRQLAERFGAKID